MQNPLRLAFGPCGVVIPSVATERMADGPAKRYHFSRTRLLDVIADVPVLEPGAVSWDTSVDNGDTWRPAFGSSTADDYRGNHTVTIGRFLPGTHVRVQSTAPQTASVGLYLAGEA